METDIDEFKNNDKLALKHWNMYKEFFNSIEKKDKHIYILDVASGTGNNTKLLSEEISNSILHGIDMNENSIKFANKYNKSDNIFYLLDDLSTCPFEFKFDYIFFLEILEYIKEDKYYYIIDKLLNLLTDDGYLFISIPNKLDNLDTTTQDSELLNSERITQFIDKYKKKLFFLILMIIKLINQ